MVPERGQIVHVRSRQYLVEDVVPPKDTARDSSLVRLSCLEDDAQGDKLEVLWEREVDARIVSQSSWDGVVSRGFDAPHLFSAYLHTLRWNCVTSTRPNLFQAPYRAGIEVKNYQLEPLRKALLLPRVNLFIADDVGLGKTIEAGLILRELLMRQKVRRVVICCPPSVVLQWRDEMEQRFGLTCMIFDRAFVTDRRRERGYGVNPWNTHSRFIISHALVRDEAYAGTLRDWLTDFCPGSLLILDEAHNAAPASGSKYAVDSKLTRTIRDLARRFEHRLFLSATPHNGHSNSFAALLEILDPQRFCRGVPVKGPKLLDDVMVRRLKKDLREIESDFPERKVIKIALDGLPESTPELQLSRLLDQYREAKVERLRGSPKGTQTSALLVVTSLQKRLLSSIEAFARTLRVHKDAMVRQAGKPALAPAAAEEPAGDEDAEQDLPLIVQAPGADDDRAEVDEQEVQEEEDSQMAAATRKTAGPAEAMAEELRLLDQMAQVADGARHDPDSRVQHLIGWLKTNLCPDLGKPDAPWLPRRVLIFTEYADTKSYLQQQLQAAIQGSDQDDARIETFHGGMGEERREAIKAAFNTDPAKHPLRILIATDAAREGVNLQNHCADLFHFDIPWNPSRMEQRNGRIDRKLQRAKEVRCHYYVLPQRVEDHVLEVLVEKTKTIQKELGSLSPVVERRIERVLSRGIYHADAKGMAESIYQVDKRVAGKPSHEQVIDEELGEAHLRKQDLARQIETLAAMLKESYDWIGFDDQAFRDTLSASLELMGAEQLKPLDPKAALEDPSTARWEIPALHQRMGADPTWAATLDSLRVPRKRHQKPWDWRKEAPIRPVVFRDPGNIDQEVVHLHLEHRLVQRLLGRFMAQGFTQDQLSRACVVLTDDPTPKVLALGRLSLYGDGASRLHDQIIAVAAEWTEPDRRGKAKLKPAKESEKETILELLEKSLATPRLREVPTAVQKRLTNSAARDVAELLTDLEKKAGQAGQAAEKALGLRGEKEAAAMKAILEAQKKRIAEHKAKVDADSQLTFGWAKDDVRQLEADKRHWARRLLDLDRELVEEPARILASYRVQARRMEPVGLVYLWPVTG